ncbi:Rubisco activation protein CbbO [uncultured Gammaproteobacteria bacterium]|nr:Rubisco activation protein CbbO [uncultured Gammaproteobacteria bacterium]
MGVELYNIFEGRKEVPSLRILERYRVDYRDDNRIIWHYEDINWDMGVEYVRRVSSKCVTKLVH